MTNALQGHAPWSTAAASSPPQRSCSPTTFSTGSTRSSHNAVVLLEEFQSRYERDYDLRTATSTAQAEEVAREIRDAGGLTAMFVTDSRLHDVDHIVAAIHRRRVVVPTVRRVVAAHWDHFLADGTGLRTGLAKGKYDPNLAPTPEDEVANAPSPRECSVGEAGRARLPPHVEIQPGLRPSIESLPIT